MTFSEQLGAGTWAPPTSGRSVLLRESPGGIARVDDAKGDPMPFDEGVAQRVRETLEDRRDIVEKKMFGGLAFMLRGNMCVGVIHKELMVRVGPDQYAEALARPHAREMDFTGKPLKGFVYVGSRGIRDDADLEAWIRRGVDFAGSLPAK